MNITILCVGKLKENYWKDAIAEYAKRLSKYVKFEIIEVEDEKMAEKDRGNDTLEQLAMEKEAIRMEKYIKENTHLVALAIEGKKYDSVAFSKKIENIGLSGSSHITFIIGGSLGIFDPLKRRCHDKISFSDMTFPHQMMRVILVEQIYRAYRIMNNEPYHK